MRDFTPGSELVRLSPTGPENDHHADHTTRGGGQTRTDTRAGTATLTQHRTRNGQPTVPALILEALDGRELSKIGIRAHLLYRHNREVTDKALETAIKRLADNGEITRSRTIPARGGKQGRHRVLWTAVRRASDPAPVTMNPRPIDLLQDRWHAQGRYTRDLSNQARAILDAPIRVPEYRPPNRRELVPDTMAADIVEALRTANRPLLIREIAGITGWRAGSIATRTKTMCEAPNPWIEVVESRINPDFPQGMRMNVYGLVDWRDAA